MNWFRKRGWYYLKWYIIPVLIVSFVGIEEMAYAMQHRHVRYLLEDIVVDSFVLACYHLALSSFSFRRAWRAMIESVGLVFLLFGTGIVLLVVESHIPW